jgi:hypothetical protein
MALPDRDIALFARDSVAEDSLGARTEADRARRLARDQANACAFYESAQRAVRTSGYRLTQRVKDGLWAELSRIQATANDKGGTSSHKPVAADDECQNPR